LRPIQPVHSYISTEEYAFYRPAYTRRECLVGAAIRHLVGAEVFVDSHCYSYHICASLRTIVFAADASRSRPRRGCSSVSTTAYKASPLSFVASLAALLAASLPVIPIWAGIQHIVTGKVVGISWSISMTLLSTACPNGLLSSRPSA
jgi:hypothetical protein